MSQNISYDFKNILESYKKKLSDYLDIKSAFPNMTVIEDVCTNLVGRSSELGYIIISLLPNKLYK